MPSPVHKTVLASAGAVAAAIGSSLCCAGAPIAAFLGLSGAGLAATFVRLSPYFGAASVAGLGYGFFVLHREERNAREPGRSCASSTVRRRMRRLLWIVTVVSVLLITFPLWSRFVLS